MECPCEEVARAFARGPPMSPMSPGFVESPVAQVSPPPSPVSVQSAKEWASKMVWKKESLNLEDYISDDSLDEILKDNPFIPGQE